MKKGKLIRLTKVNIKRVKRWKVHTGGNIVEAGLRNFIVLERYHIMHGIFFLHFLINKYIINIKLVYYIKIFILIFFNGIGTG